MRRSGSSGNRFRPRADIRLRPLPRFEAFKPVEQLTDGRAAEDRSVLRTVAGRVHARARPIRAAPWPTASSGGGKLPSAERDRGDPGRTGSPRCPAATPPRRHRKRASWHPGRESRNSPTSGSRALAARAAGRGIRVQPQQQRRNDAGILVAGEQDANRAQREVPRKLGDYMREHSGAAQLEQDALRRWRR